MDAADQAPPPVYQEVHAAKSVRFGRIEAVVLEAAAWMTSEGEATMLRIHPSSEARRIAQRPFAKSAVKALEGHAVSAPTLCA